MAAKNSAMETRGARNKEPFTLLVGSYREPLTQMPSWERGGKGGDRSERPSIQPKGTASITESAKGWSPTCLGLAEFQDFPFLLYFYILFGFSTMGLN